MSNARIGEKNTTNAKSVPIKAGTEYNSKNEDVGRKRTGAYATTLITRRDVNEFTFKALKIILAFEEEQKGKGKSLK